MRHRSLSILLAVVCAIALLVIAGGARAQGRGAAPPRAGGTVMPPGSTPVLTFESDDAEEQAEAFTSALRAKLKSTPGWTLSENTFSLGILTAALKCRLDAPCLQRVGDQLRTDKFFWGRVSRVGKTQVSVEAHFWQRGKHDSVVKESYSDDLRDPNNDALKKIAGRIFERLTGTLTTGTVLVRAGKGEGAVLVDGAPAGELSAGQITLELKAGAHTIEVRADGYLPVRQTANVVVGAETQVTLELVAPPAVVELPPSEKPTSSGRKVLAYSLIGAGVVAGAIGVVQMARWYDLNGQREDLAKNQYGVLDVDPGPASPTVDDACNPPTGPGVTPAASANMKKACDLRDQAVGVSTIGWILGGAGVALVGTGVVLLVTDTSGDAKRKGGLGPRSASATQAGRSWTLTPVVGPREQSVRFGLTF